MKVWLVMGQTESGDDFGFVFAKEPTPEELAKFFARVMSDDWEADCIQSWSVSEEEIIQ